jgi:hypothetical protein
MNVDQLLRVLKDLPGCLPVVVEDSSAGWMQGAGLYLAPAHFDRRTFGTFLHAGHQEGPDDCQALVISAFHQPNPDYLEISESPMWTPTIDAEVDVQETRDAGGWSAISAPLRRGTRPIISAQSINEHRGDGQ